MIRPRPSEPHTGCSPKRRRALWLGALVGNFGGHSARKAAVEATGLPALVIALVEDAARPVLLAAAVQDR